MVQKDVKASNSFFLKSPFNMNLVRLMAKGDLLKNTRYTHIERRIHEKAEHHLRSQIAPKATSRPSQLLRAETRERQCFTLRSYGR